MKPNVTFGCFFACCCVVLVPPSCLLQAKALFCSVSALFPCADAVQLLAEVENSTFQQFTACACFEWGSQAWRSAILGVEKEPALPR